MKKFKEFEVKTHGIKHLTKALANHAESLGYSLDSVSDEYDYGYDFISLREDGDCLFCFFPTKKNIISLDEFFNLTTKDVIDEPERLDVRVDLSVRNNSGHNHLVLYSKLEASQIEKIKDIMNEGET